MCILLDMNASINPKLSGLRAVLLALVEAVALEV